MATKINHTLKDTFYFITIACFKWLSLFEESNVFDYFPTLIKHMKIAGITISGYVIMPNHFHLLVFVHSNSSNLNKRIGTSKRFLAYEIIKRLKKRNKIEILEILEEGVRQEEKRKGKKHQVFQPSFDAKEVQGENEIVRVLDYIHHNPVSKKWMLVKDFINYPYSSAQFYLSGNQNGIQIVDYRAVWSKNSSESSIE